MRIICNKPEKLKSIHKKKDVIFAIIYCYDYPFHNISRSITYICFIWCFITTVKPEYWVFSILDFLKRKMLRFQRKKYFTNIFFKAVIYLKRTCPPQSTHCLKCHFHKLYCWISNLYYLAHLCCAFYVVIGLRAVKNRIIMCFLWAFSPKIIKNRIIMRFLCVFWFKDN